MNVKSRRFQRRRGWKRWLLPLLLLGFVVLRVSFDRWDSSPRSEFPLPLPAGDYDVVRVVDGDTLIVRPAEDTPRFSTGASDARLRLLGIDCPESVKPDHPVEAWGPEATVFTREFVRAGRVSLALDKRRIDRYGRYLAYVYVDHRMLNLELIRAGLARVSTYPGDSERVGRRLLEAEAEAKSARRGIWSTQK